MTKYKSRGYWLFRQNAMSWLIILPTVILFAFFVWVPLINSIILSMKSNDAAESFVFLDNYLKVFKDSSFLSAVANTFQYTLWSLLIGFLLPIIMALVMGELTHGKSFARVSSYLPNVMPGLAAIMLWKVFFSEGASWSETGFMNQIVKAFGYSGDKPINWLAGSFVIPIIVVIMTWKGAGATALIYMAGLSGINPELYEAATIDGANIWHRIRHITVPTLFSLGSTMLILQIISIFQIIYEPMVLTNGGPAYENGMRGSVSLMQLAYEYAFTSKGGFSYGKASAVSVLTAIILVGFTLLYNKVNKKINEV